MKLDILVIDTNERYSETTNGDGKVVLTNSICERYDIHVKVADGQVCSGSNVFYRLQSGENQKTLYVTCN